MVLHINENCSLFINCFFSLISGSSSDCDASTNRAIPFSTFSRGAVAESKMQQRSLHPLSQLTTNPTKPLITQMQPPMLPPPPHPNFQLVDLHTQLPVISDPLSVLNSEPTITQSQTSVVTSEGLVTGLEYPSQTHLTETPSRSRFRHQVSEEMSIEPDSPGYDTQTSHKPFIETPISQLPPKLVSGPAIFTELDSYSLTQTRGNVSQSTTSQSVSITMSTSSQTEIHQSVTESHQLVTENQFSRTYDEPTSTQITQTKLVQAGQSLHRRTHQQPSPTISQISQTYHQQRFNQSVHPKFYFEHHVPSIQPLPSLVTKPQESQTHQQPSPMLPKPTLTIYTPPQIQPRSSPTPYSRPPQPQTESFPLQHKNTIKIQPSISSTHFPVRTPDPSHLDPEVPVVHQVNVSNQVQQNISQQGHPVQSAKSANDTELTEWLKRNTSQSPMTSNDPR